MRDRYGGGQRRAAAATQRDRRAAGPDRARRGPRRPSTACTSSTARTWRACPYEDIAVQLGETGPLDEAALAARVLRRRPRRLLLRAQHGAGGAAARGAGSSSPTTRRSSAAKARRTTWRCWSTSTASAGWPTPASARASSTRCRSARARPTIGPFTYTLTREAGGTWWMGQHEWGSFTRLPDDRGGVHRRRTSRPTTSGWRTIPSRASSRRWSSRAARPDRIVTLRARTLSAIGPAVDDKRVRRARRVRAGPARRVRDHARRRAAGAAVGAGRRPARGVPGARLMRVATHPGNFHADDVFAVAVLGLVHGPLEVVRTRDDGRAGRRRRPRRRRRALGPRDRRLRPPPARRRGRARQRHPLRELRPRLARVRRVAGGRRGRGGRDRRAARAGRRRQRHRPEHLDRAGRRASAR